MENDRYPFVNLPLPYSYGALEPFIDEKTMMLHHDRHLAAYIKKLNAALENEPQLQKLSLENLIKSAKHLPEPLKTEIINNAGGVFNHRFFFNGLDPHGFSGFKGKLGEKIREKYGSEENFLKIFTAAAMSVFGSGYAWLVLDGGILKIITSPNQNSPIAAGLCPILNIDVWEHAYYLKHYNLRADYIEDWKKLINANEAEKNYFKCAVKR